MIQQNFAPLAAEHDGDDCDLFVCMAVYSM